ncbi:phenylacetate--CoA ligase family protein [Lutibacter sp.]
MIRRTNSRLEMNLFIKQRIKEGIALLPDNLLFKNIYFDFRKFLKQAEVWSRDKIITWQFNKLKELLTYVYENVEGYKILYDEHKINPNDFNKLEDLKYFPIITKEMIRDNLDLFTSKLFDRKKLHYSTTGGSTAVPLGFYKTKDEMDIENAFIHHIWSLVGFDRKSKTFVLRGSFIGNEDSIVYHAPSKVMNSYFFSVYYLNESSVLKYWDYLNKINPEFIYAYPSAIHLFSKLLLYKNMVYKSRNLKAILTSSENLYEWQKRDIAKVFPGIRIFDLYGQSERVVIASGCEYDDKMHLWPFYGYTEIMKNNTEVAIGEMGEIIGTSFWSLATPFVRYKIGDIVIKGEQKCKHCGRNFPVINEIQGRLQEIIVSRKGRYIPMVAINMHDSTFDNVKQFQFFQEKPGEVILNLITKNNYSSEDEKKIFKNIKQKLGDDFDLKIKYVKTIELTSRGKYRFLVQKLPIDIGDK